MHKRVIGAVILKNKNIFEKHWFMHRILNDQDMKHPITCIETINILISHVETM